MVALANQPSSTHRLTTCTFCGVGCGIYLETSGASITGACPSMSHPANRGRICVRGWHVHEVASSPDRLTKPLIRRNGSFEPVSWNEAYDFTAERLQEIRKAHGPDAIGFVTSPRCSNEEAYLLQKLARAVVGTNNVVHGLGLHRMTSIHVLRETLGVPAATSSIEDLAKSGVIVVDGIDLGNQLPTIGGAVIRAKLAGSKLIATGNRSHRVAESADHFLQIRPHTDVLLYGAMAKVIVDRGLVDLPFVRAHCDGYEELVRSIRAFDVLRAADQCGVEPSAIEEAALTFARCRPAMILYSTGVEARGEAAVQSLVNLVLLTGNLGREGGGLMPLAEHNNLQGGCDMGMLPDFLPGYAAVTDEEARVRLGRLWQATLPSNRGVDVGKDIAAEGGRLRALWLDRHDPLAWGSAADPDALQQLEFLVAQQLFATHTAQHAHVILPVVAFGEEQVTFTSTERRIQLTAAAATPPAGPVPAWQQIVEVAQRLGADWRYAEASDVMDEIAEAVPEYGSATYDNLAREYGRQWPCPKDKPLGTRFFFEDGYPQRRFAFTSLRRPPTPPEPPEDFPFIVVMGLSLYYWHRNVLVQHSETLKREYGILLLDYPEGFVEINTHDAERLGIRDGKSVRVTSISGSMTTLARVTPEVKAGSLFVPYFLQETARSLVGPAGETEGHQIFVRIERAG
jgi:predicted molibdopterin-dependent oxidoreductase YjgC